MNQAEQIFEFEALAAAVAVSLEALRFVDVLLGMLLAAQLVVGTLLIGRGDAATAVLAVLGVAFNVKLFEALVPAPAFALNRVTRMAPPSAVRAALIASMSMP